MDASKLSPHNTPKQLQKRRSTKVSPAASYDNLTESQSENGGLKWHTLLGRRVSEFLHLSDKQTTQLATSSMIKEIPGSQRFSVIDAVLLKMNGLDYFSRKARKYESTVYNFNLGRPSIFVCDWKALQNFFDDSQIQKEPEFGRKRFNLSILGDHMPSMFSNDNEHVKKKSFIIALCHSVNKHYLSETAQKIILNHLETWDTKVGKEQDDKTEERIQLLVSNILTQAFFAVDFDHDDTEKWLNAVFKKPRVQKQYQQDASESFKKMYKLIQISPRSRDIFITGREQGLSDDEAIKEILFAVVFNGLSALSNLLISAVGHLNKLGKLEIVQLQQEAQRELYNQKPSTTIPTLQKIEKFILEVIRLHASAPFIFGRTRSDDVIESETGKYQVVEGDSIIGSLHHANRSEHLFRNPETCKMSRFNDETLKQYVTSFGGNLTTSASASNRKCPGQEMSISILKLCIGYIVNCEIQLKEEPNWTGKRLERLGLPDDLLIFKEFNFVKPTFYHDLCSASKTEIIEDYTSDDSD